MFNDSPSKSSGVGWLVFNDALTSPAVLVGWLVFNDASTDQVVLVGWCLLTPQQVQWCWLVGV